MVGPGGYGICVADILKPGGPVQLLSRIVVFLPYALQFSCLLEIDFSVEVLVKNILPKAYSNCI